MAGIVRGEGAWSWRALLVATAGVVAAGAFAGAIVSATRRSSLGAMIAGNLGGHSVMGGAVVLALVVAIPMAVTAGSALFGDRRAATAAVTSGVMFICWVLSQMAVVQALTWLQPLYLVLAIVVAALGLRISTEETEL